MRWQSKNLTAGSFRFVNGPSCLEGRSEEGEWWGVLTQPAVQGCLHGELQVPTKDHAHRRRRGRSSRRLWCFLTFQL